MFQQLKHEQGDTTSSGVHQFRQLILFEMSGGIHY